MSRGAPAPCVRTGKSSVCHAVLRMRAYALASILLDLRCGSVICPCVSCFAPDFAPEGRLHLGPMPTPSYGYRKSGVGIGPKCRLCAVKAKVGSSLHASSTRKPVSGVQADTRFAVPV